MKLHIVLSCEEFSLQLCKDSLRRYIGMRMELAQCSTEYYMEHFLNLSGPCIDVWVILSSQEVCAVHAVA